MRPSIEIIVEVAGSRPVREGSTEHAVDAHLPRVGIGYSEHVGPQVPAANALGELGPLYVVFHAVRTAVDGALVGAALALDAVQQAPVAATSANAMRKLRLHTFKLVPHACRPLDPSV